MNDRLAALWAEIHRPGTRISRPRARYLHRREMIRDVFREVMRRGLTLEDIPRAGDPIEE